MKSVSKAGYGLLVWVAAIVKYHEVAKNVEPLRIKVRKMEKDAAAAEKELGELNQLLGELQAELSELNSAFEEKNGELQGLKNEADMMARRLAAAAKLITGLSGERTRWEADIEKLNAGRSSIFGDCLISSAFCHTLVPLPSITARRCCSIFSCPTSRHARSANGPVLTRRPNGKGTEVQQWNALDCPAMSIRCKMVSSR